MLQKKNAIPNKYFTTPQASICVISTTCFEPIVLASPVFWFCGFFFRTQGEWSDQIWARWTSSCRPQLPFERATEDTQRKEQIERRRSTH